MKNESNIRMLTFPDSLQIASTAMRSSTAMIVLIVFMFFSVFSLMPHMIMHLGKTRNMT